ncbi:hypothetical protein DYU05_20330 [Mucilaginibacter terrenus]|uniref:Uncharacterized protein n=1 Tax=Mucilaginibacter terrenus TaxID=2482727 RepID=A0A3E2NJK5_9SPHI|nr:hypothetical protein [Mucilaginibacter terrenus]RFZ81110.1 hypothetical protein DYU05_20330 [Mucilaginibacter terrenus]
MNDRVTVNILRRVCLVLVLSPILVFLIAIFFEERNYALSQTLANEGKPLSVFMSLLGSFAYLCFKISRFKQQTPLNIFNDIIKIMIATSFTAFFVYALGF